MTPRLAWTGGGEARVVSLDADAIALVSTRPFPPGSRVEGTLAAEPAATVRVKVHASRRQSDGTYAVNGRTIDMRREVRERIAAMVERPQDG